MTTGCSIDPRSQELTFDDEMFLTYAKCYGSYTGGVLLNVEQHTDCIAFCRSAVSTPEPVACEYTPIDLDQGTYLPTLPKAPKPPTCDITTVPVVP